MPRRDPGGGAGKQPSQLRQGAARLGLPGVVAGYGAVLFILLYRPTPADGMGQGEILLTWASLMGNTFLPHLGLALLGWLAVCLLVRARKTALAGVPLLAMSLGPWLLGFAPAHRPVAPVPGQDSLLVLSANLLGVSRSDVELVEQVSAQRPDIILLQEVREGAVERLTAALGDRYTHIAAPRPDFTGVAIFSRLPFTREPRVVYPLPGGTMPHLQAWVEWQGREVCVWDVHLPSPVGRSVTAAQARTAWAMGPVLDGLMAEGEPMIVAGDFNSPWRAQPLDALRGRGFAEAFRSAGRGSGASWPSRGLLSLPPGIRIDQISFTPQFRCVDAWMGRATSSDHLPNFARFVFEE